MNAIEVVESQHREVEALFSEYESLGADSAERKREIRQQIVENLSRHAAMEEQALYPTIVEVLPGFADKIEEELDEHQSVKEALATLQNLEPDDAEFDATLTKVIADVRGHVEEEERDLLPKLRGALDEEALTSLGDALQGLWQMAPTHPHPETPNRPPFNVLAAPAVAILDRVRDLVRDATQGAKGK